MVNPGPNLLFDVVARRRDYCYHLPDLGPRLLFDVVPRRLEVWLYRVRYRPDFGFIAFIVCPIFGCTAFDPGPSLVVPCSILALASSLTLLPEGVIIVIASPIRARVSCLTLPPKA